MAIEINYTVEKKEFIKHRFMMQLRRPFFIFLLIIFSLMIVSIIINIATTQPNSAITLDMSNVYFLCIPLIYLGILYYGFSKGYNQATALKSGVQLVLNEDGYHSETDSSRSSLKWINIKEITIHRDFLNIHFNKIQIVDIPRRFIEENDLMELKEILEKNQVKNNL